MGNYTQEYSVDDIVEVTQDTIAVGGITFKDFLPIIILIAIVGGLVGAVTALWMKVKRAG